MITIVDYGAGNLANVKNALDYLNIEAEITFDPGRVEQAEKIILPGVGAFAPAIRYLQNSGLAEVIQARAESGCPLLGICLGMQLMFSKSEENGLHPGLGLIPGRVRRFRAGVKIPHMGWNTLRLTGMNALTEGIDNGGFAYFVHSLHCIPDNLSYILAWTEHGENFASIVGKDSLYGMQFHPEKSQKTGMRLLENFGKL